MEARLSNIETRRSFDHRLQRNSPVLRWVQIDVLTGLASGAEAYFRKGRKVSRWRVHGPSGMKKVVNIELIPLREAPELRWPLLNGLSPQALRTTVGMGQLGTLLDAVDELDGCQDADSRIKRAVDLCRRDFGLERSAIFLFADGHNDLRGTWGTNLEGGTQDESYIRFPAGYHHRKATIQALAGVAPWLHFSDVPLFEQHRGEPYLCGNGWNVITPILGHRGPLGFLVNDTAASRAPLNAARQMRVALFCRFLGARIDGSSLGPSRVSAHPLFPHRLRVGHSDQRLLVVSMVQALDADPSLTAKQLGKRFAVSSSVLTRAFLFEMGISLVDHRNRVRLERFLHSAASRGGSMMQLALESGFGSYAQFHRVFCKVLGVTPRRFFPNFETKLGVANESTGRRDPGS